MGISEKALKAMDDDSYVRYLSEKEAALTSAIGTLRRKIAVLDEPSDIVAMRSVRMTELRAKAHELRARAAELDKKVAELEAVDGAGNERAEKNRVAWTAKLAKYTAELDAVRADKHAFENGDETESTEESEN